MDIVIEWDKALGRGDWKIADGSLAIDGGLKSAVLVSLFTDRRAAPDFVPTDGTTDRRGWWADTYEGEQIGSRLWQYERAKKFGRTTLLAEVKKTCAEALQWLLDDGVAASLTVNTGWLNATTIAVAISITQPNGNLTTFNLAWAWDGI
ncbi:phage GP46 family protein [Roseomonas chloroacetimidivorans]|uniref:phage GP46 family protein n=1 Tax=Roseomonas chloroacetimidivorans TaxID=1766656 RepID=UPI003C70FA23